ncbi:hypothetical protein U9M49_08005 [Cytobacillus sp. OWB-43]|uniref:hypothetical protein n=1 Tax=Cytobacillus sp. OWB-43 TaxID=3108468 RepID=UPI002B002F11|nr:hypothetical protein [Cytobacillus sp. OWB-43]MEA1853031.1 hypothetical protein [Cytobacillus sp. OWB-43]
MALTKRFHQIEAVIESMEYLDSTYDLVKMYSYQDRLYYYYTGHCFKDFSVGDTVSFEAKKDDIIYYPVRQRYICYPRKRKLIWKGVKDDVQCQING